MSTASTSQPWYGSLPSPQSIPNGMSVQELHGLTTEEGQKAGQDYIVIDVRRADMDVSGPHHAASRSY
jgi:hypothetical protein